MDRGLVRIVRNIAIVAVVGTLAVAVQQGIVGYDAARDGRQPENMLQRGGAAIYRDLHSGPTYELGKQMGENLDQGIDMPGQ